MARGRSEGGGGGGGGGGGKKGGVEFVTWHLVSVLRTGRACAFLSASDAPSHNDSEKKCVQSVVYCGGGLIALGSRFAHVGPMVPNIKDTPKPSTAECTVQLVNTQTRAPALPFATKIYNPTQNRAYRNPEGRPRTTSRRRTPGNLSPVHVRGGDSSRARWPDVVVCLTRQHKRGGTTGCASLRRPTLC